LLDVNLPGIDGFEVCARLKANELTRHIPVLMLSGVMTDNEYRIRGLESGADGYLCKPFETIELIVHVRALLRISSYEAKLRSHEQYLEEELTKRMADLAASEERYRLITETASDYVFCLRYTKDGVYRREWVTDSFTRITGYLPDEPKDGWRSVVHPDDVYLVDKVRADFLAGIPNTSEYRIFCKNGEMRWLRHSGRPVWSRDHTHIERVYGSARDITDRKLAEEALKENQRVLKTLLSNLPGIAYRCCADSRWTMVLVSEGSADLTGYAPEELIGNRDISYGDLIHEDDRAMVQERVLEAVKESRGFEIEYRIVTKSGEVRSVWEQGRAVTPPGESPTYLEGFISDVTERIVTRKALMESVANQRRMVEGLRQVASITEEIILSRNMDDLYHQTVELVRRDLGVVRCAIFVVKDEMIRGTFGTDADGNATDERGFCVPLSEEWRAVLGVLPGREEARWRIDKDVDLAEIHGDTRTVVGGGWRVSTPIGAVDGNVLGVFVNDGGVDGSSECDPVQQELIAILCMTLGAIIERKQIEWTAELNAATLRKTVGELERVNEASVGWEQRMIDLKRQVNELSVELGRPAPFDVASAEGE
jgi:PAS domain S-box-containing protein